MATLNNRRTVHIRVVDRGNRTLFKVNYEGLFTEDDLDIWRNSAKPLFLDTKNLIWKKANSQDFVDRNVEIYLRYCYAAVNSLYISRKRPATSKELAYDYKVDVSRISRIVEDVARRETWKTTE